MTGALRLLTCAWLFAAGQACAQAPVLADPLPDYPAGSIKSVEQADRAIAAGAAARKRQLERSEAQRRVCLKDFFTERCLTRLREEDHQTNRRISAVEQEARDFRRHDEAAAAAQRRAERVAKEQADAARDRAAREQKSAGQARKVERNARDNAEFDAQAGERASRAAESRKREQDRIAARQAKEAEERALADERAQRARERQAYVDGVLKRAKEREAKAQQKEKDRQAKSPG